MQSVMGRCIKESTGENNDCIKKEVQQLLMTVLQHFFFASERKTKAMKIPVSSAVH